MKLSTNGTKITTRITTQTHRGERRSHALTGFALSIVVVLLLAMVATPAVIAVTNETLISSSSDIVVSLVNQDPDPATSGDVVEFRIGVENRGQESIQDMTVEFSPSYPFRLAPGESGTQVIGSLPGHQVGSDARIVKFKVQVDRDAIAGQYNLKLLTYRKGDSARTEQSVGVSVTSQQNAEIAYIDQVELLPGKITPMTFTINNVGSAPLRDVTFSWKNAGDVILPVGSDDTTYIKYIEVGKSVDLVYDVIASSTATPNLYKLDLTLTYREDVTSAKNNITTSAGIYVGGGTDFDVAYSGRSGTDTAFSVSNIGSVAANSVTVSVPSQAGWRVSGSNAVIIGNLNEGDYTIASFSVQQAENGSARAFGAGRNNTTGSRGSANSGFGGINTSNNTTRPAWDGSTIAIDIAYTDSRGNRNIVTKQVNLDMSAFSNSTRTFGPNGARTGSTSQSSSWSMQTWLIIAAIALVAVWLFVRSRYKRGRLDDPKYTYSMAVRGIFGAGKRRR